MTLGAVPQRLQLRGQTVQPVPQHHPRRQGLSVRPVQPTLHLGVVHLVHVVFGGEQGVAEGTVISEEQEPLGILVQPPHREEPPAAQVLRQQVQHCLLPPVLCGGQEAAGLWSIR